MGTIIFSFKYMCVLVGYSQHWINREKHVCIRDYSCRMDKVQDKSCKLERKVNTECKSFYKKVTETNEGMIDSIC